MWQAADEKVFKSEDQLVDLQARNQGEAGWVKPPLENFSPPLEKCVEHSFKILDIVQKIWASLGVPSWLRARGPTATALRLHDFNVQRTMNWKLKCCFFACVVTLFCGPWVGPGRKIILHEKHVAWVISDFQTHSDRFGFGTATARGGRGLGGCVGRVRVKNTRVSARFLIFLRVSAGNGQNISTRVGVHDFGVYG